LTSERWTEDEDCISELMDILGYEFLTGRMSPEMQIILERHLEACPCCRRKFAAFVEIASEDHAPTWIC
jgi:anti-sigma factor RsiW